MKRPSIPRKQAPPSAADRLRALIADEPKLTEAELIADLERDLQLPPGFFDEKPDRKS